MSPATLLHARVVVAREHFTVDVDLRVDPGESIAVMGPSGAGKSTLLHALAGLQSMRDGEISVDGRVIDRPGRPRVHTPPSRRGIVLLGQEPRLFPHLTVRENVAFGLRAAGADAPAARTDADSWLERVGLPGTGSRRPGDLSGGEQQRVAVARALAASPRVVLLDEPLVALDPETAGDIRRMLRDQLAGTTTVAVTHDAADAVALADRLVVVERGRVSQAGTVRDVLAAPASGFVASLTGVNRVEGVAEAGGWRRGGMRLISADGRSRVLTSTGGARLAAVFHPSDVRIVSSGAHDVDASGSGAGLDGAPWSARVLRVEPTLAGLRVHTDTGAVDVPLSAVDEPAVGDELRLRIAPEHVRFVEA